ncbi:hypothetical protein E3O25_04040 [Cryobacterium sp. TMT1-3]|uniref:Uncharacterized protein n=1 Tax=Cryobacterium luteum TaxID=1424661 RepID=A0A1H8GDB1_9MICO|nr:MULTISPECIES: hypothetical protein [Cryobacterium]TFB93933.1 hypothetical protein E3O10_02775 [Cryobacterium luteum]TFC29939.1 hypothetical protein E3O25_04040 [Cryobacterium sp. TMT1-3]SEN41497.1 hypothetical protein SAMN05216281_107128 [Cryobacterium luteum]
MITLQQDADGFIRMNRHFPDNSLISIRFTDGAAEQFTGAQLNAVFDDALAEFRGLNRLEGAKGFSRAPAKTVHPTKNITFVKVHPKMAA